jgi:dTDP-glucose 4,6-dehydratase
MSDRILVTGGLGFIGSAFIRHMVRSGRRILNVDAHTYAADQRRLETIDSNCVDTLPLDVSDDAFLDVVKQEHPRLIVHFAAESHVTRSERRPDAFYNSNVQGTHMVLEAALAAEVDLMVHISTDEVYGPCHADPFREEDKVLGEGRATSAYARTKALADDLALSYSDRLPLVVVRPTNCFGPYQHPEKAIPRWITRAIGGSRLPVWGDGGQVRDWMFVENAVTGIETVIEKGTPGVAYNLAPGDGSRSNREVAQAVARAAQRPEEAVYLTEYDRPDHDRRYAVDASRIRELGWTTGVDFDQGIARTVDWYSRHIPWWTSLLSDAESLYSDAAVREE